MSIRVHLGALLAVFTGLLATADHGPAQPSGTRLLQIGTSGTLAAGAKPGAEETALKSLRRLIKEETGLDNEIVRHKGWRELADDMADGSPRLGVFQGYEFAWAREKHPKLQPLALAVSGQLYPVACAVTRKDSDAADFAALRGQSVAIPGPARSLPRLFAERQARAGANGLDGFFSKVSTPESVEDALDDVVDGKVQSAVVDRAGLDAYRRRKPGRFKQLKEVARSQPVLPAVVASYGTFVDRATLRRFRDGLLGAAKKERGRTMLTLFRLTGFADVPSDFDRKAAETLEAFPPDGDGR